jgi:hypothetical protein
MYRGPDDLLNACSMLRDSAHLLSTKSYHRKLRKMSTHLLGLPLRDLGLVNVPQLVDAGRLASRNTLGKLDEATNSCSPRDSVLYSLSLDTDDTNAGILWATVVLAITKVTNPGLQSW